MSRLLLAVCIFAIAALNAHGSGSLPIPIKVVVVTMFEVGAAEGDRPGEFQFWVERLPLPESLPFPEGHSALRINRELGILGLVTGAGGPQAAVSITALGLDSRFDLRRSYWVVAGIAGVDPADASPGSAAWARWVIDGDLMHEIDGREIPADWPHGIVALGAKRPNEFATAPWAPPIAFPLNAELTQWAYELTREIDLGDTDEIAALRARYLDHEAARQPPRVLLGESLCSSTYWHGRFLTAWANDWVKLWTNRAGNFVMTAMEDQGTAAALKRLDAAGRVDFSRLLVLRTASNFSEPPSGVSAAENVSGDYAGFLPALEAAWKVGSPVVRALAERE